jgi:hypothetical protein
MYICRVSSTPQWGLIPETITGLCAGLRSWPVFLICQIIWLAASLSGAELDQFRPLTHVSADALVLHNGWRIESSKLVARGDQVVASNGFDVSTWHTASVPTTVLHAMVVNGIYPDPAVGTNNMLIPDANEGYNQLENLTRFSFLPGKMNPWDKPWWFRNEFVAPEDYRGKVVWLNFGGINYRADVWLNGQMIANSREMAGIDHRFRFDVSSAIRPGSTNTLAVLVYPPDVLSQGAYGPDLLGGTGLRDSECYRNVGAPSLAGWDYVNEARDRGMGIWQDVWLQSSGPVILEDPQIITSLPLPATNSARVTIRVLAHNATSKPQQFQLGVKLSPKTFSGPAVELSQAVQLTANATVEVVLKPEDHPELALQQPHLWWPAAYGRPDLYHAELTVNHDGASSFVLATDFGVRVVDTRILATGGREFFVNGRKIRISGGAWVMDPWLSKNARRYEDEIKLAVAGNQVMLRQHGPSVMPPDVVLDACDRLGVLFWCEFFSDGAPKNLYQRDGGPKQVWSANLELYLDSARDNILRLRNHPSLAIWVGLNEDWLPREIYDPLYDLIAQLDGTRHFLTGSHQSDSEPSWVREHSEVYSGGPWIYRDAVNIARSSQGRSFGFRSEVGFPTPPPINSVTKFIPDWQTPAAGAFPLNNTMGYHQAHMQFSNGHLAELRDFGPPADLADYLMGWEFLNQETHGTYYEALNKIISHSGGGLLWKSTPASPCFLWSTFDWYLRPNAGYYAVQRANVPRHVQYNFDDQSVGVVSVAAAAQRGLRVTAELRDQAWQLLRKTDRTLSVTPNSYQEVIAPAVTPADQKAGMLYLQLFLYDSAGSLIDRNFYVLPEAKSYEPLRQLPPVKLEVTATVPVRSGADMATRVTLKNPSASPALLVTPSLLKTVEGEEILPSFWEDRYIALAPGEARTLAVHWPADRQGETPPYLIVEGWNVLPVEIALADGQPVSLGLQITQTTVPMLRVSEICRAPMNFTETGPAGSRITTWPVSVSTTNGQLETIRVGVSSGKTYSIAVPLQFDQAGETKVSVGGQVEFSGPVAAANPLLSDRAVAYVDGGCLGLTTLGFLVTDDSYLTAWNMPPGNNWIFLELSLAKTVREVVVKWGENTSSHYTIQVSNDLANWRTVAERKNGPGGEVSNSFDPVTARYVKVEGAGDSSGGHICEIQVK